MTIDNINTLIVADESRTLELKKTTGELKDGMHTACAFLNTEGGWLIFGITPKSLKIIGQKVTDNTQQEIAQALAGLEPMVDVKVEYVDVPAYPGNKVIAMHFDGWVWGEHPHTYNGCPYYKVESTTKVMPQTMYDERIRAHKPLQYAWEGQTADEVSLSDLNEKHIRGCIRLGVEGGRIPASAISAPIEETLSKWKLLKNGIPTNGAAMLFSDNIDEYPQFRLRMARFVGTDKNEFIDNQRAEGNFFDLLDAGMAFFFKHLNLSGKITNHSLQRQEQLEIPYMALRETLINSLCHRQWEKYNLTNSIAIYDDRIEIANPGVFPPQITPENIKKPHESYPYNLKIAEALYKSTFLESWGSGAKRIIDACDRQGVEEPIWKWDSGFIIVTFKRHKKSIKYIYKKYDTETETVTESVNVPVNVPVNIPANLSKLNDRQRNIYNAIKNSTTNVPVNVPVNAPVNATNLAIWLNVSEKTIKRDLSFMQSAGIIKRVGSDKTGHWEVIK